MKFLLPNLDTMELSKKIISSYCPFHVIFIAESSRPRIEPWTYLAAGMRANHLATPHPPVQDSHICITFDQEKTIYTRNFPSFV
jgi:hypothetical protein